MNYLNLLLYNYINVSVGYHYAHHHIVDGMHHFGPVHGSKFSSIKCASWIKVTV